MVFIFYASPFQTTDNIIAAVVNFTDNIIMGKPAIKQNKGGINSDLPCPVNHLYKCGGLFAKCFLTPVPSIGSFINISDSIVGASAGCIKYHIEREKINSVMIPQPDDAGTKNFLMNEQVLQ